MEKTMKLIKRVLTSEQWHAQFPSSEVIIDEKQGTIKLLFYQTKFQFYMIQEGVVGIENFMPNTKIRDFFSYWLELEESIYFVDRLRTICVAPKSAGLVHRFLKEGITLYLYVQKAGLEKRAIEEIPIKIADHPKLHHRFSYMIQRKEEGWELIKQAGPYINHKTSATIKPEFFQLREEKDWDAYLVKGEQARNREKDWIVRVHNTLCDNGKFAVLHNTKIKNGVVRNAKVEFTSMDKQCIVYACFSEAEDAHHVLLIGPQDSYYLPLTEKDFVWSGHLPDTLRKLLMKMERTERYVKRLDQDG